MTARAIHQGLGLIFPCNDRKNEVNEWYLLLGNKIYIYIYIYYILYVKSFAISLALQPSSNGISEITCSN